MVSMLTSVLASVETPMYVFLTNLLQPYLLLMLILGLTLLVLWGRAHGARRVAGLAVVTYVVLWLFSTPLVAYWAAGHLERGFSPLAERPEAAQAMVVLGGGTIPPAEPEPTTRLSEPSLRRCLRAAELYRQGPPCLLVVAGGKVDPSQPGDSEAQTMRALLTQLGVSGDDILLEERSRDTYENAVYTQQLLAERRIECILLVTDATHLGRAVGLFEQQGLTVVPAASHYYRSEFRWDVFAFLPSVHAARVNGAVVHEWLGALWIRLRPHPQP
jgi:uncharacterized SAM-binding protein YcdF (DUF218 family)